MVLQEIGAPSSRSSLAATESDWPAWVEVDLDTVRHNVRAIQAASGARMGVLAVVKAQAYGLGAVSVAAAALEGGAYGAAVARVSEGALLRRRGFGAPILVLGGIVAREAPTIVEHRLTPTVTEWETAEHLARAAGAAGVTLGVHLKVDTGITRYGAPPAEIADVARRIHAGQLPSVRIDGFFSHFASADEKDPWFARQQLAYYRAIVNQLETEGVHLGLKHVANSAGALRLPDAGLDLVRAGLALSGSYATEWVPRDHGLRSSVALKSRVARLHEPPIGTSIGYGRTYKVQRPIRTALVTCGYADGLPRALGNHGSVLIHGQRAPLIGTVSMDMAMADITHIASVQVGDEVVILGRQGEDEIRLDDFARSAGIIPHEALVRLGARAPRVYLQNGQPHHAASLSTDEELPLAV